LLFGKIIPDLAGRKKTGRILECKNQPRITRIHADLEEPNPMRIEFVNFDPYESA
jgi:hypothetical protein